MKYLALATLLVSCASSPPKSRAQRIGKLEETIGGPHAIGQVGDWLLENDQIRLIVADKTFDDDGKPVAAGRVNTNFGGTLVDADLQRIGVGSNGNDQLAELLPGFVFSVIDPTEVCVPTAQGVCPTGDEPVLDGSDGGSAEILVTGVGGDLLQMVALLNTGLVQPQTLQLTQIYELKPGDKFVTIHTTVKNTATGGHPFPFLDPTQIQALGFNPPAGIGTLQLSVPMGQLPLLGGEQDLFMPGVAGFNVHFAIEDSYNMAGGFPSFPGLIADFLASRGKGVSYGLTVPASTSNYVNTYAAGYPGQTPTPYSILLPFTYAGVSAVYMAKPPDELGPQEEFTFDSYFVIGKGDVASILDTIYTIRQAPTGTFGGRVLDANSSAPVTDANILVLDAQGNPLDQIQTDTGGNFLAHLAPGTYSYKVLADERLTYTAPDPIVITANQAQGALILMDAPATIDIQVLDDQGRHAPVKIQLLGHFDPTLCSNGTCTDPRTFLYSFKLGERQRPTAFDGTNRFIENAYWTKDGRLSATVRPGTYDIIVSRGPEYEVTTKTVTLTPGAFDAEQLVVTRSYISDGWVAGDFHIHAQPSTDSGLPIDQRVISCAAEGLEVATATDHNYITDYAPVIADSGLDPWLVGIPGMELTTFEMGHFIGYPLHVDPGSTRGGEFKWVGQAPQTLFDQLRTDLGLNPGQGVVTVAHPRQQVLGYFAQFFVDENTAEPYTPTGLLGIFAPYGEEFKADHFSYDFDALELVTGRRNEDIHTFIAPNPLPPGPFPDPQPVAGQPVVTADGHSSFPGVAETWFTMLDHGLMATGMGASDSHHLLGDEPGYARTMLFVGSGKDVPGGFTQQDVIAAIHGHHAIATNAPFLQMTIGSSIIGDTIAVPGGQVDVNIHVQSASWAPVDHLRVYSNGGAVVADMLIPASQGTDFSTTVHLSLTVDSWVVAEVTGPGNLFPVISPTEFPPLDATVIIKALSVGIDLSTLPLTAKLVPSHVHTTQPFAMTNPIWIAIDNNPWTAPKPPLPKPVPIAGQRVAPPTDVRKQFDALPEVTP